MPAAEIIAIITGVVGCAAAILTPCVRLAFQECSTYLKIDEEHSSNLYEEEGILRKIIQTLASSGSEIADKFQLMNDAEETLAMINECRNVETCNCFGLCSSFADYRRSYKVGKYIDKIKKRVNRLRNELRYQGINIINVNFEEQRGEFGRIRGGMVGQQGSKNIQEILSNIVNSTTGGIIGVYGACGVGKTEAVALACDSIFQDNRRRSIPVTWIEVSNEDDLLKLQTKIAHKIDPKLAINDSVRDNAIVLKKALLAKKTVLIVLDNMRNAFSLEEIGFPAISNSNITIIITSRSLSLCKEMQCYWKIPLKSLSDEESYELLINEIGLKQGSPLAEEVQFNLKKIAKECGGLPLTIVAVAKYLRRYYCYEQLKHSSYSCAKECLLFCTMYTRNQAFAAMELMMYWMGEGLLREVEGIDEKLGEAKEILEELKDASLLESIAYENGDEIVRMHPLVWDMSVKFEKENPRFFTKIGCKIEKFPYEDWSESVERVSLRKNNLKELPTAHIFSTFPNLKILDLSDTQVHLQPDSLSCLKHLTVLLLRNCCNLACLPSLSELVALMILDISGCCIAELPSLSHLVALMVLNVSGCPIAEFPSLSELVELMVLDISNCPISELPHGMDHLTKLVRLNLSRTQVRSFPSDRVAKYSTNLQQLSTIGCNISWTLGQDGGAARIEDVQKLGGLGVLEITLASLQFYYTYISSPNWRQLSSFKFCVGKLYEGKLRNNSVAFKEEFPDNPLWLPNNTSELLLMDCRNVTQLTIPHLLNLKFLKLSYCQSLKHLFTYSVFCNLGNLEEIVIAHCQNLVKLVEQDSARNSSSIFWRRLRKLTLFDLPELKVMYNGEMVSQSMQEIGIWDCPKLQVFPIYLWFDNGQNLTSPPGLKEIRGDDTWLVNLKQNSNSFVPFLENTLIQEPPPEELTSRDPGMLADPSNTTDDS
ncbi:Disease resistance protein [Melia azedarach]|uniref:Disease resistance protein n=1 Tax=Melia azedarach TaxID=155640 RepID=A0ACC1Y5L1_MELAZ|nr:Disease resistance protein [Melia azedarach]